MSNWGALSVYRLRKSRDFLILGMYRSSMTGLAAEWPFSKEARCMRETPRNHGTEVIVEHAETTRCRQAVNWSGKPYIKSNCGQRILSYDCNSGHAVGGRG